MKSVLDIESQGSQRDANKFAVFIAKNPSITYVLKKKVPVTATMTSMLYSSEL